MRPNLLILPLSCLVLAVAAIVIFTSGGSASPAPAVPAGQGATVTQHLVLDSTDFVSQDNTCTLKVGNYHGIGGGPGDCQNWMASVHVPDDSTIVGVKVTYTDGAEFGNLLSRSTSGRSTDSRGSTQRSLGSCPTPATATSTLRVLSARLRWTTTSTITTLR